MMVEVDTTLERLYPSRTWGEADDSICYGMSPDELAGLADARAGVYDAPLLHRMQKLVAILPAYELLHVDFGEIAHAPPGFHAGSWRELFGADPAIANYLFYPQPTTMVATTFLGGG